MTRKKVLAVALSAAMVLSTAACGEPKDTAESSTPASSTPAASESSAPASSTTSTASEATSSATSTASEAPAEDIREAADLADIVPKDTVTLDVYDQLANYSGEQIGWFAKVMLDKFNVKLNIIPESDGTYDTRMESGDLGDIVIWGSDGDQYQQAVTKGMLFDWNEDDILADYGPYINNHMKAALEKNQSINSDGKVHGFGHSVAVSSKDLQSFMYTWDLRFDLYQQIGSPEIKDLDSMVDVLEQMQKACPKDDNGNKTYGVSLFNDWDGDMVMFVKSLATAYYGYDEFGIGLYDPSTKTYHPALEENGPYLTCLKFYNKLFQKGLLDPDSQTQGFNGMSEDYQNGTAFLNIFNFMGSAIYNSEDHVKAGKAMYPVRPTDAHPLCYGQSIYGGNRIWSIGANTEYPELCMAIINWLSTPDGVMTYNYGPKDLCWTYDANGDSQLTDLGKKAKLDGKTELGNGYDGTMEDGSFKMNNETWALDTENPDSNGETYNYRNWKSFATEAGSDIEKAWRDWAGADTPDQYMLKYDYILSPGTDYVGGTHSDDLQLVWDQVTQCLKENTWKAIYAKDDAEFDSIVADMTKQCKDYGYDQCVEFQQNEATIRAAAEDKALTANN